MKWTFILIFFPCDYAISFFKIKIFLKLGLTEEKKILFVINKWLEIYYVFTPVQMFEYVPRFLKKNHFEKVQTEILKHY